MGHILIQCLRRGAYHIHQLNYCFTVVINMGIDAIKEKLVPRLREVFHHWMRSAEGYFDPEEFRISLNACIQSIRNVTFALQKQKENIKNFSVWYAEWQDALKRDPIMRWCVEARNEIVKQEDLKTKSLAKASLLNSYYETTENIFSVSPFLNGHQIAEIIKQEHLPEELCKDGYLKVEKQWIVENLPEIELLSVLSHAFTVLFLLIDDIEAQKGPSTAYKNKIDEKSFISAFESLDDEDKPKCMLSFEEYRTTWLKLSTGDFVRLNTESRSVERADTKNVEKKYGFDQIKLIKSRELKINVENFLKIAKHVLKTDKYHFPTVIFVDRKGRVSIYQTHFHEHDDKYLFWEKMAKEVKRRSVIEIITIGDTWHAPFDPNNPGMRAGESEHRKEALLAVGLNKAGEEISVVAPYYREGEEIRFGEDEPFNGQANFLNPIKRLWARQKKLKR